MHNILKVPVTQPIGNSRELTPSSKLGLKQDNSKELRDKKQQKDGQKRNETIPPRRRKTEEEEESEEKQKKKMVFSDRKDYIHHQMDTLKKRVDNKDSNISAHRYIRTK